jgi:uncharacterized protein (UPF0210 family)
MNIRALTGFVDPGWPIEARRVATLAACLHAAKARLEEGGYPVQTLRLATPPPAEIGKVVRPAERPEFARKLEAECFVHGIDYASLGPALPEEPDGWAAIPDILGGTENVFTSVVFCEPENGLSLSAARGCAQAISDVSRLQPDGFTNLRFAGLANVPAGSPFFPSAYHRGGWLAIAAGTEAAELAVDALRDVSSVATARRRLVGMIEAHGAALAKPLQAVAGEHEARFLGIDFSLAPYPEHFRSIGAAIESFGAGSAGGGAASRRYFPGRLPRSLPSSAAPDFAVCSDGVGRRDAAARALPGNARRSDLLVLSTVVDQGWMQFHLPGDASVDGLTALLLDLGACHLRLQNR